jgi:hypothetical protein
MSSVSFDESNVEHIILIEYTRFPEHGQMKETIFFKLDHMLGDLF